MFMKRTKTGLLNSLLSKENKGFNEMSILEIQIPDLTIKVMFHLQHKHLYS